MASLDQCEDTWRYPPRDRRMLSFGNGSMRQERNSSRERSKTLVWCSAVNAAVRNAFSKKEATTRVEASSKGKKGQTKMRRRSSVQTFGLCFLRGIRRSICEQQCATRAAARVPSEHASSLAGAGRQDRDRQALQQTSRRHQNNWA